VDRAIEMQIDTDREGTNERIYRQTKIENVAEGHRNNKKKEKKSRTECHRIKKTKIERGAGGQRYRVTEEERMTLGHRYRMKKDREQKQRHRYREAEKEKREEGHGYREIKIERGHMDLDTERQRGR